MPRRKRRAQIRALIDERQEPLDLEPPPPPSRPDSASWGTLAEWRGDFVDAVAAINRLATDLPDILGESARGAANIEQIERQADFGIGVLETILEAVGAQGESSGDGA